MEIRKKGRECDDVMGQGKEEEKEANRKEECCSCVSFKYLFVLFIYLHSADGTALSIVYATFNSFPSPFARPIKLFSLIKYHFYLCC